MSIELDTRGRQAYGFSAEIKLKSEIPLLGHYRLEDIRKIHYVRAREVTDVLLEEEYSPRAVSGPRVSRRLTVATVGTRRSLW